jgi:hypothetical protein
MEGEEKRITGVSSSSNVCISFIRAAKNGLLLTTT